MSILNAETSKLIKNLDLNIGKPMFDVLPSINCCTLRQLWCELHVLLAELNENSHWKKID